MCMLNATGNKDFNTHIYPIGTYAEIVDFDMQNDGFLSITVVGKQVVDISDIKTEDDDLRVAQCTPISPWCCDVNEADIALMRDKLKQIFERYNELNILYDVPDFDDPIWVIHRWLELIPVDPKRKQYFIGQKDCQLVLEFLKDLVQ